ncbi:hypothetical protein N9Z02_02390 [Akkermansiaceae bacterium]|nr:hypothetical protein [Akkermansiaceae bacterium]
MLQVFAWSKMVHDRAPSMGVSQALNDAFSGENPCEICCAIAESTEEERQDAPAETSADKLPKFFTKNKGLTVNPPALDSWSRSGSRVMFGILKQKIPTPPPELV